MLTNQLRRPDLNHPWSSNFSNHMMNPQPQLAPQFSQPNSNPLQSSMTSSSNGQFQTPRDRLAHLNRNINCNQISNTVNTLSNTSF